ncbi:Glu-tRNA amidotransferase subunit B [Ramicandelaber brevisporus]|nr:Glu-tRNA amidotransferase subunit B [Ramicandelaber brevisporus]
MDAAVARGRTGERNKSIDLTRWEPVIGLEVHAQLNSRHKLFSSSPNIFNASPNSTANSIDLAYPGVLPRLNPECVTLAMRAVLAFGGSVQDRFAFDRKHYFYPDLPQGYQITQKHHPVGRGGSINVFKDRDSVPGTGKLDQDRTVNIEQIQLEQDTAKTIHDNRLGNDAVLVDYNRAGSALIEIVMKPDVRSAAEAAAVLRKIQSTLRHYGISDGRMEEGSLRCDVNVSVRERNTEAFGVRCELKNLNTIKVVAQAVHAELARQVAVIENGGQLRPETRGFDAIKGETFLLRSKETAADYRYMPETDIAPVRITHAAMDHVKQRLPESLDVRYERVRNQYGMSHDDYITLTADENGCLEYFEQVATKCLDHKLALRFVLRELFSILNHRKLDFSPTVISADNLADIANTVNRGEITLKHAKECMFLLVDGDKRSVKQICAANEWFVSHDVDRIAKVVEEVLKKNPKQVEMAKQEKKAYSFLVGMAIKQVGKGANPQLINEMVRKHVDSL